MDMWEGTKLGPTPVRCRSESKKASRANWIRALFGSAGPPKKNDRHPGEGRGPVKEENIFLLDS